MSNQFEVMQFDSSASRDAAFDDLRMSDQRNEQQVVKFSSCEQLLSPHGNGELELDSKGRVRYVSTFFVAYPRLEDEHKTKRRQRKDKGNYIVNSLGDVNA